MSHDMFGRFCSLSKLTNQTKKTTIVLGGQTNCVNFFMFLLGFFTSLAHQPVWDVTAKHSGVLYKGKVPPHMNFFAVPHPVVIKKISVLPNENTSSMAAISNHMSDSNATDACDIEVIAHAVLPLISSFRNEFGRDFVQYRRCAPFVSLLLGTFIYSIHTYIMYT